MNFTQIIQAAIGLAKQYAPLVQISVAGVQGIALAIAARRNSELPPEEQLTPEQIVAALDAVVVQALLGESIAEQEIARAEADQAAEASTEG